MPKGESTHRGGYPPRGGMQTGATATPKGFDAAGRARVRGGGASPGVVRPWRTWVTTLLSGRRSMRALSLFTWSARRMRMRRENAVYDGDRPQPIIVDVEQYHLRLRGLQNEVPKLLDLQARLERQLQLRAP